MVSRNAFLTPWNYVDADPYAGIAASTITGPGWLESGDISLANLHSRFMMRVARYPGGEADLFVDLGEPRLIQCCAIVGHNLSSQATIQVTGYDDAGYASLHQGADTGVQFVWPRYIQTEALPFEARNWWTGQPTLEDVARMPRSWFSLLDQPRYARYWKFHFTDANNPWMDISRLILAPILQFGVNFLYDSSFGPGTRTTNTYSLGGVDFPSYRPPYRVATLNIQHLAQSEAMALVRAQFRRGIDRAAFMCIDPSDIANRQIYSFMAKFQALVPMIFSRPGRYGFGPITFEEAL